MGSGVAIFGQAADMKLSGSTADEIVTISDLYSLYGFVP